MKEDRLDLLLHALFEESLGEVERAELNALLAADPQARARYRRVAAIHSALARKAASPSFFEAPAAPKVTAFPKRLVTAAAAVAVLAAGISFMALRPRGPVANVLETQGVAWAEGSAAPVSGRLPAAVPLEFTRGFVRLGFPSGAKVTLEAPCRFRLDEKEALSVLHGRASVHTPDGAEGFRIDTPGGRFVDLGTEFGLAVGSDGSTPVVLTEVFKGEVEIEATSTRLTVGESRALVREEGKPKLLAALDESPVMLVNHLEGMPGAASTEGNLALGKPVFSPGYCTRPHGSIFPPDNLTDGRLNDSGVPGDWSFWLAPDGESGEFTVDLLQPERVGRVSLQNTNNRGNNDRGTESFALLGSPDNKHFFPLTDGELPRVTDAKGSAFPFYDFTFAPVEVRYVKLVVTRHYRHPQRPIEHPCQGGGLNEIRIFAE
jgi:hypothetical protein